jgi:hypothetical protein
VARERRERELTFFFISSIFTGSEKQKKSIQAPTFQKVVRALFDMRV